MTKDFARILRICIRVLSLLLRFIPEPSDDKKKTPTEGSK